MVMRHVPLAQLKLVSKPIILHRCQEDSRKEVLWRQCPTHNFLWGLLLP